MSNDKQPEVSKEPKPEEKPPVAPVAEDPAEEKAEVHTETVLEDCKTHRIIRYEHSGTIRKDMK